MREAFAINLERTRAWFGCAAERGWLDAVDAQPLQELEHRTPGDLFAGDAMRPLVVALFGGTGVGKSSLLNRLAGEQVARSGVERPTSREVTVFVHASVEMAQLPDTLPIESVRVERHHNDQRRDVLWIDAPDIDSTQLDNRELVWRWLPHVDLLVYVVSPERYRDDVGWRALQERGQRHGWMFVMNRWDEGHVDQREDWTRLLRGAGFDDPLVLCTSCRSAIALPSADEFDRIDATLRALLDEHGVRELERLGYRARFTALRGTLSGVLGRLGGETQWDSLVRLWDAQWQQTKAAMLEGVEWPLRARASRLALSGGDASKSVARRFGQLVRRVERTRREPEAHDSEAPASNDDAAQLTDGIWDDWMAGKLGECLDRVEVQLAREGMHPNVLRRRLEPLARSASDVVSRAAQDEVRASLAQPGTALQRGMRIVTGFLSVLLPGLASLWVAYNVVQGYWRASQGQADWLGWPFAVNSALLVLVAWGVPFAMDRALLPSLERAALAGLRRGVARGVDQLGAALLQALADARGEAEELRDEARSLIGELSRPMLQRTPSEGAVLSRLVAGPPPGAARSAV